MDFKEQLVQSKVVLEGDFTLRSGKKSNKYIEKNLIYCNKDLFKRTIDEMVSMIQPIIDKFDVIVGPEKGGLILAAPIALELNKTFAFTEKHEIDSNNFMVFRDAYLSAIRNKNILIVDDIMTTGGSINRTMDAVINAAGTVIGIVCIWNRGSVSNINDVPVRSIINELIH